MIETIMIALLFLLGLAKKTTEPRWVQMTLTGGSSKGAVDWLKPNTNIHPSTIRSGKALDFRDDGFHIPDFVEDGQHCLLLIDVDDVVRRPLLIHQKTAVITCLIWMSQRKYSTDDNGRIETIHTDEPWSLTFRRGKGKFDPYTMSAEDLSEGPGGPV